MTEELLQDWENSTRTFSDSAPDAGSRHRAHIVRLDTVQPEPVQWLWPGRIPLGKLTILDGDPGLGKSSMALDLAARISRGDSMPNGTRGDMDSLAGTVLLTAEDGLADTIRPRLDAMGAHPERIAALQLVYTEEGDAFPTVGNVDAIREAIHEVDARLVIIDPLVAHLGGDVNSHRDQDVRAALAGLSDLAERLGVAVVAIRHLNKSSGGSPLYRGGGSIGLIAAARSGLLVAADPDDGTNSRRILASTKSNLAAPVPSLAYRIEPTGSALRIRWEGETGHQASELLSVPSDEERTAIEDARDFLLAELTNGPRPADEILKAAKRNGHSERTLRRAKNRLNVVVKRRGFGASGEWRWGLPTIDGQGGWQPMENADLATNGNAPELCRDPSDSDPKDGQLERLDTYGAKQADSEMEERDDDLPF